MTNTTKPALSAAPVSDAVATVTYTNWRGETSVRRIIPKSVRYGSTEWHPEPQWLLLAWDDDKKADREFALKDFGVAPVAQEPVARLCGYCKTWNSKPCGEQCYLQPSDPVWTSPPATPAGVGADEIAPGDTGLVSGASSAPDHTTMEERG